MIRLAIDDDQPEMKQTSANVQATAIAGKRVNDSCNGNISCTALLSEFP